MKKAILTVSVGTSIAGSDSACIRPIETALQMAFPDRFVFRAFTSRMIRRILSAQGICIDSPEEALRRLTSEGFDDIAIASAHIIPGMEYDSLLSAASGRRVSTPLLACEQDLDWMADLLVSIAGEERRPLLLMGHGSGHAADIIYSQLRERLPENIFLACLKGEHTLDRLLPHLDMMGIRQLSVMPLMLVAGRHVQSDLAGEGPDSWKSILESQGCEVYLRLQGLGSLPAVQQRFVEKAKEIL